jgi:restriction system protein
MAVLTGETSSTLRSMTMAVPTYDQFIEPLLRCLAAHPEGVSPPDAYEAMAHAMGLSEAQRQELLPSGTQPVYKNRVGWANDRLKRLQLSVSPKRAHWQISRAGAEFVRAHPHSLTPDELQQISVVDRKRTVNGAPVPQLDDPAEVAPASSPKARMTAWRKRSTS